MLHVPVRRKKRHLKRSLCLGAHMSKLVAAKNTIGRNKKKGCENSSLTPINMLPQTAWSGKLKIVFFNLFPHKDFQSKLPRLVDASPLAKGASRQASPSADSLLYWITSSVYASAEPIRRAAAGQAWPALLRCAGLPSFYQSLPCR